MDSVSSSNTSENQNVVKKLIEGLPNEIREIAETIRAVAMVNMPRANEFVYHNAINYKLPESPGTWICYIAPQKKYVRFGFFFGANLFDPKKLLEGTGQRMRHIKVKSSEEASTDDLAELIRQAWTDAAKSL